MKTTKTRKISKKQFERSIAANLNTKPAQLSYVDYLGTVNYATNERILGKIRDLYQSNKNKGICLTVTSPGGPTGTAMSFYDHLRYVLKPRLTTIASGDVDSSGVIIFLSGDKRFVTKHTTCLLHLAGRTFPEGNRFTAPEIEAMILEDKMKDEQYASVVAENSRGKLTKDEVLELMRAHAVLDSDELVQYGLADQVIE